MLVYKTEKVIKCFLNKFQLVSEEQLNVLRLPKKSLAADLMIEAGILSSAQVAQTILTSENNTPSFGWKQEEIS